MLLMRNKCRLCSSPGVYCCGFVKPVLEGGPGILCHLEKPRGVHERLQREKLLLILNDSFNNIIKIKVFLQLKSLSLEKTYVQIVL